MLRNTSARDCASLFLVLLLALGLHCQSGLAVELGETREAVIARHGVPKSENAEGFCCYEWEAWTLGIKFIDGVAVRLAYGKNGGLTESDILGIFAASGGTPAWTKTGEGIWARTDGATASFHGSSGAILVLKDRRQSVAQTPTTLPTSASGPSAATSPQPIALAPRATPHLMAPPSPFKPEGPAPNVRRPESPNNHFWLMALSWVPLLALILFGKYAMKRQGRFRTFGPQAAVVTDQASSTPPATIDSVSWDQFELVIAELYRRQGYTVEVSSGLGADGGIDVKLTKPGELVLVQCKQWKVNKVTVQEVRAFFGVMVSEGAQRGLFVSTGEYTRDCRAFAEGKPIGLLGKADLNRLVQAVQCPGENLWELQAWLPAFEAAARITTPTCPFCQTTMVLRNSNQRSPFWGCPKYPRCRGKREARLELLS